VGALLRAIDGYEGRPETVFALKLAPHVFLRPDELRQAKWSEIDFADKVWRIPAERMKKAAAHGAAIAAIAIFPACVARGCSSWRVRLSGTSYDDALDLREYPGATYARLPAILFSRLIR